MISSNIVTKFLNLETKKFGNGVHEKFEAHKFSILQLSNAKCESKSPEHQRLTK